MRTLDKARPEGTVVAPAVSPGQDPPIAVATGKPANRRGAPVQAGDTLSVPKKAPSITVDAVSLVEMAGNNVSGGRFTATVPMRSGEVALDIGQSEPIKLRIPAGVVANVSATLKPTPEGLLLTDVKIDFGKHQLDLLNPGAFIGGALGTTGLGGLLGGLLGGVVNSALDVKVQGLGIDDSGLLQPYGMANKAGVKGPLENAIPKSMLPRFDLHLAKFVGAGTTSGLPKLPSMDPRQLLAALGGIVEQAKFELQLDGPSGTIAVGSDGAEIQSPAGRGTLKLSGDLKRDASNALVGRVDGHLDASIAATIELKPSENAIAANGMKIGYRDQRLMVDAGDLQIARAIAGQVSVFVGDSLSLDATTSATIGSELTLSFTKDGALTIAANNVTATLGLAKAAASSPHFTLALGDPSSATFKLAELGLGSTGIVARGADGSIDLKVESGQLDLGGAKFAVSPGRLAFKAKAESAETGGSIAVAYDLPVAAAIAGAKATGKFAGTFEMNLAF